MTASRPEPGQGRVSPSCSDACRVDGDALALRAFRPFVSALIANETDDLYDPFLVRIGVLWFRSDEQDRLAAHRAGLEPALDDVRSSPHGFRPTASGADEKPLICRRFAFGLLRRVGVSSRADPYGGPICADLCPVATHLGGVEAHRQDCFATLRLLPRPSVG